MTLKEHIAAAREKKIAIGHFNVSTLDGIWAVADAAHALNVPVIIGVSEGERDYTGVRAAAAVIQSIRKERGQAIFLNADHTYSFDRVKEAVDAGYDAVIFDGAALSLAENMATAKKSAEYAHSHMSLNGEPILMECELGFIGQSSKVLDKIPDGAVVGDAAMTKPEDALAFVQATGIDLLAPAVGNIHGVVKGGDPALNTKRVKEISDAVGIPLVLHGASGNTSDDIRKCVRNGVGIVHVNTELRMAYRAGLMKSLTENSDEVAPYKFLRPAKQAMQKVVEEKLRIINDL